MYHLALQLHSWNRWVVLLALLAVLGRAYRGWLGQRPYHQFDDRAGGLLLGTLSLQLLLGVALYGWLSPWTQTAFQDWSAALHQPMLRFWAVQHVGLMGSGILVASVGRRRVRRATTDADRHRLSAVYYSLSLGLLMLGLPFAVRLWG